MRACEWDIASARARVRARLHPGRARQRTSRTRCATGAPCRACRARMAVPSRTTPSQAERDAKAEDGRAPRAPRHRVDAVAEAGQRRGRVQQRDDAGDGFDPARHHKHEIHRLAAVARARERASDGARVLPASATVARTGCQNRTAQLQHGAAPHANATRGAYTRRRHARHWRQQLEWKRDATLGVVWVHFGCVLGRTK